MTFAGTCDFCFGVSHVEVDDGKEMVMRLLRRITNSTYTLYPNLRKSLFLMSTDFFDVVDYGEIVKIDQKRDENVCSLLHGLKIKLTREVEMVFACLIGKKAKYRFFASTFSSCLIIGLTNRTRNPTMNEMEILECVVMWNTNNLCGVMI